MRASGECGCELRVKIAWELVFEAPHDGHWAFTLVAHIPGAAKEPECPVGWCQARHRQDGGTHVRVVLVATSGQAACASGGLAFPVQQAGADSVVAVAGGRREVVAGLVD